MAEGGEGEDEIQFLRTVSTGAGVLIRMNKSQRCLNRRLGRGYEERVVCVRARASVSRRAFICDALDS